MSSRHKIVLSGLLLASLAGASGCQAEGVGPKGRLNVVLVLADDLGWRDLGCYGSQFYETPAIDRLAQQGMRFTRAYAAGNVCSPTRASLMTGNYPARLHTTDFFGGSRRGKLLPPAYRQSLPAEMVTLAEAFRRQGYRTAIAGKWHLGGKGSLPEDHGFEVVIGGNTGPGRGPAEDPHFARWLSEEAARFIEQAQARPFFLYLSLHSVHIPLKTAAGLREKYEGKAAALPPFTGPRQLPVWDHQARAVQDHAVYAGMIQEMDQAVEYLLKKLEELGLAERTIVVFTSDNGGLSTAEGSPTSNLPLRAGKGWNYEGGIRVPLIVRLPGRIPGDSKYELPVISNDLYPTLLELAGVPVPKDHCVDGLSLARVLQGKGSLPERPLFWHYPHYSNQGGRPGGAVLLGNWKLIEWYEDGHVELYDLSSDPGEQHDLAKAQPERAAAMQQMLADWRRKVGAQMPTVNPEPVEPFGPYGVPSVKDSPGGQTPRRPAGPETSRAMESGGRK